MRFIKCHGKKLLKKELKHSYYFFMKEANLKKDSKGYGLIRDKSVLSPEIASIASVGYGLAALGIGVNRNWIAFQKAYEIANRTLATVMNELECFNGFYYHFINMETGKREWNCEVSIIDTAIFICGALFAGEFFGGDVKQKAEKLYKRVNWNWYRNDKTNQFYMGYSPERGFWGKWDMYAEQLMMYVLGVASPTYSIGKSMYDEMIKPKGDYGGIEDIIYTYCGTLFTYQFSHAWIDFKDSFDKENINWFENSIKATKTNREYCIQNSKRFKTFGENSWGLTPCVGPNGYSGGFGALPAYANLDIENNGTVAPCGAIGSIVFTPEESIKAIENYYNNFPKLWCRYGFRDGFNLEKEKPWYSTECIGIDKGITILMIENYLSGLIWEKMMQNTYIKKGLHILGINKKQAREEILV